MRKYAIMGLETQSGPLWSSQVHAIERFRERRDALLRTDPTLRIHQFITTGLNVGEVGKKLGYSEKEMNGYMNNLRKANELEREGCLISLAKSGVRRRLVEPESFFEDFTPNLFERLTGAEWLLIHAMGSSDVGSSNSALAKELSLAEGTVALQKKQVNGKLQTRDASHKAAARYVATEMILQDHPEFFAEEKSISEHVRNQFSRQIIF